jgi:hypothetical protein
MTSMELGKIMLGAVAVGRGGKQRLDSLRRSLRKFGKESRRLRTLRADRGVVQGGMHR